MNNDDKLTLDDELARICAHIGNVIRLAAIVGIDEVEAALQRSARAGMHAMLLDPARTAETTTAVTQNMQLIGAFRAFRSEIAAAVAVAGEAQASTLDKLSDESPALGPFSFIGVSETG